MLNVMILNKSFNNCEAQARVRQGSARDGSQGERPKSLNPCLELTLKLVATNQSQTFAISKLYRKGLDR